MRSSDPPTKIASIVFHKNVLSAKSVALHSTNMGMRILLRDPKASVYNTMGATIDAKYRSDRVPIPNLHRIPN